MPIERSAVRGSERQPMPNSQTIGIPDPNELIAVTVMLRRRNFDLPKPGKKPLAREDFAALYGADPVDLGPVEQFAADNDLTMGEVDLARRSVVLSGTVANMNEAFGTEL